jgi:uncharacterized protein DUF2784
VPFGFLADVVLVVHLGFVLFVATGGLLVLRWPRAAWVHLPAVVWGVFVEWSGRICPLTPLENWLRERGGARGYSGDFVEHYLLKALYPADFTRSAQILLGATALLANLIVYAFVFRQKLAPRSP